MNPNHALESLLRAAAELSESPDPQTQALAEMFLGLDEWLGRGGELPTRWSGQRASWASADDLVRYRGELYRKV